MGKHVEIVFQKKLLKPNAASHNNPSWYTDTDGFLKHSPRGGSLYYKGPALQKIILVLGGPLSYNAYSFRQAFYNNHNLNSYFL